MDVRHDHYHTATGSQCARARRGYTVLELLVVLFIIAIAGSSLYARPVYGLMCVQRSYPYRFCSSIRRASKLP